MAITFDPALVDVGVPVLSDHAVGLGIDSRISAVHYGS